MSLRRSLSGGSGTLRGSVGCLEPIGSQDDVAWTAGFAQKEMAVSSAIEKMSGIKGRELWITVNPAAGGTLENKGWKVQEKVATRFLRS